MKYIILLILTIIQFEANCQTSSKDDLIEKLIDVQGTTQTFETVLDNMIDLQKEQITYLDDEFWDESKKEMSKDDFKELKDLLKPIYDKHFSENQIIDLINFYESKTGKYLVKMQPTILNESMAAGAQWGEKIGEKIYDKILDTDQYLFNLDIENCDDFKTGEFEILLPDSSVFKIVRTDSTQIEVYQDMTYKFGVEWIGNCKYKIVNIGEDSGSITEDIIVNIYELNNNNCKIISKAEGVKFYRKTEMYKVK